MLTVIVQHTEALLTIWDFLLKYNADVIFTRIIALYKVPAHNILLKTLFWFLVLFCIVQKKNKKKQGTFLLKTYF